MKYETWEIVKMLSYKKLDKSVILNSDAGDAYIKQDELVWLENDIVVPIVYDDGLTWTIQEYWYSAKADKFKE